MPKMLAEFLEYLENQNCNHPHEIQEAHLKNYLTRLHERPCKTKAGAISLNYIRKHLQVIKKFSRYLSESGQESFTVKLRIKGKASNVKSILTNAEVTQLYDAAKEDALGMRDKAMLALYYGCGLRKNEGVKVDVRDILIEKDLLYVRKGKGHRERYVPLAASNKADLTHYIQYARPYLVTGKKDNALLLNINGKRLSGATAYERLQKLRAEARLKKAIGLHTLRHSIASHLLHSGMKLEQIQRFLGHRSLESTQIYTHLKHEQV
ncbi:tyrosine-type recombinase/integrase [Mucilaginibacter lutimaris]|uniref:Tyrosine-type recombinase/integrase n=1 Tax=Mucilaginibacter lutimaris TaxID=931629 RepID=A0ABW2ZLP1_9SPHI